MLAKRPTSGVSSLTHTSSATSVSSSCAGVQKSGFRCLCAPSLAVVLIALVVTAIALPVIASIVLTIYGGNALIREQAASSSRFIASGLSDLIEERLLVVETLARENAAKFESGVHSTANWEPFLLSLIPTLLEFKRCSDVCITTPDGGLWGIFLTEEDSPTGITEWIMNGTDSLQIPVDERLTVVPGPSYTTKEYNGTDSEWYSIVTVYEPRRNESWTTLYLSEDMFWESYAVAALRDDGSIIGVVTADWEASDVGVILGSADIPSWSVVVIIECESELMLAISDANVPLPEGDVHNFSSVAELTPSLLAANRAIKEKYGSWAEAAAGGIVTQWADSNVLVNIVPVQRIGLMWAVAVISVPALTTVQGYTLGASVGIAAAFVIVTLVFSVALTRSINGLSSDMDAITHLDFDHGVSLEEQGGKAHKKHLSFLKEIRVMQKSYVKLKAGTKALTKYIAPTIVQRILNRSVDEGVTQDMKLTYLTILFTDLRGFTTLSEECPHETLIKVLSTWFEQFGTAIESNGGTVDKFIGDCIMALFGAPVRVHQAEVASCRCALAFAAAMKRVNQVARDLGCRELEYRVGLHCGPVLLGNLGYSERLNYTVCGNTANVASRMEQLGKTYKLSPLVSSDIVAKMPDKGFVFVLVDVVVLRGHSVDTHSKVYHLACERASAPTEDLEAEELFERIHQLVRDGSVSSAVAEIDVALEGQPLEKYKHALRLLRENIVSGVTCPESYNT